MAWLFKKKKNYIKRHQALNEDWDSITPASASRWLLWSGSNLEENLIIEYEYNSLGQLVTSKEYKDEKLQSKTGKYSFFCTKQSKTDPNGKCPAKLVIFTSSNRWKEMRSHKQSHTNRNQSKWSQCSIYSP